MIEYPWATAERMAEDSRVLAAAVREFEGLLGHLRSCEPCYTNEPCLERHVLIKDVQRTTEQARALARRMTPADQSTPQHGGESH